MALQRNISGFTLIELMVSVGIIGVLVGIAIPAYNGYMTSSAGGVGLNNVAVLRAMQEAYRVENFTYLVGSHNAGDTTSNLMTQLHWVPNDNNKYSYTVTAGLSGNIATSLEITATCDLCSAPIVNGN